MSGTKMEPYEEMRRHLPILWTVIKYLRGRDLLSARVIDPYWRDAISDTLQQQERMGKSRLKPIEFGSRQTVQHFLAAFPPAQNPTNEEFPLFQFGNLHLTVGISEFDQILDRCGPHLKFATIVIPLQGIQSTWAHLNVLLNKCKVLEKLSLTFFHRNVDGWTQPQISESVVLQPLPTLKRIHVGCSQGRVFENWLGDLVKSAPNLRLTTASRSIYNFHESRIQALLKPLEQTVFVKLTLDIRVMKASDESFWEEVGKIDLKVVELILDLHIYQERDESDVRNGSLLSDWLTKLNKNCFQKLSLSTDGFRIRFPPVLGLRCLSIRARFDTPIDPAHVPNLEDLTLPSPPRLPIENNVSIFAPGKVFPRVKKLQLVFPNEVGELQLRSNFPNVEIIEIINHSATGNGSLTLRNFLQFPNLVKLSIEFNGSSSPNENGIWWNIVTGGMLPQMGGETALDVIFTKTDADADGNEFQTLFHQLPNLRSLKLSYSPQGLIFAIIHLTGTDNMLRLHTLQLDPLRIGHGQIFKHFVPMLKRYHNSVVGF